VGIWEEDGRKEKEKGEGVGVRMAPMGEGTCTVALGSQSHMHACRGRICVHVHLAGGIHHSITSSKVDAHDACPEVSKRLDHKHEPQNHCHRCHPRRELVRSAHCVPVAQNGANLAKCDSHQEHLSCPIELIRQTPSADLTG